MQWYGLRFKEFLTELAPRSSRFTVQECDMASVNRFPSGRGNTPASKAVFNLALHALVQHDPKSLREVAVKCHHR
jgi:hypothetical protein